MRKILVTISTKFTPSIDVLKKRAKLAQTKLKNMSGAHKKISVFLDQWTKENFKTEGGKLRDGKWKPFAAGGRKKKGKPIDTTARLLQDTGRLRVSVLPFANKRTAGIGSKLSYSKVHDKGTNRIPKRRILPKINEVRKDVREIFNEHTKNSLKVFK